VLSEAYSYLSFQRRVEVTEAFVETLLGQVVRRGPAIQQLLAEVDRDTAAGGGRGTLGPLGTSGKLTPLDGAVPILVGDVETRINPRSGRQMTVMQESVAKRQLMQDYGFFSPVDPVAVPRAYVVPGDDAPAVTRIANLAALHGIRTERLTEPSTIAVEVVVPEHVERSVRAFQGHQEVQFTDARRESRTIDLPAGSLIVPMNQPLARLAFHLLEPTSDDGVVNWNMLDEWIEDGKAVPIYRVMIDARFKSKAE
jgi:hypothetical protein